MKKFLSILGVLLILGCEPFVTEFKDLSDAVPYEATSKSIVSYMGGTIKVVTWNIRFGIARFPFFGDSCGDDVILDDDTIEQNMAAIADSLNAIDADIVLLQEVDVSSKRTGYMDQVQYLLDNTNLNYGCYASMWKADFIPSDGIGRIDAGNAILSKYKLTDAERIQLPLRTDQDDLTQYFYLRRNILKAKIALDGENEIYAVNIHATAFATDDTKKKHITKHKEVLDDIVLLGATFVTGGDFNSIPPGADSTDFCKEDICSGESFHTDANGGPHKEGSYFENFTEEPNLIKPFYQDYFPAIDTLIVNNAENFTHSPWNENRPINDTNYWDRKLDYLFTNIDGFSNGKTHQEANLHSDHAPVSATFTFP